MKKIWGRGRHKKTQNKVLFTAGNSPSLGGGPWEKESAWETWRELRPGNTRAHGKIWKKMKGCTGFKGPKSKLTGPGFAKTTPKG